MADTTDPAKTDTFIALRARYEALMEIPMGAEIFEVVAWLDALHLIINDAKLAGLSATEVFHR